MGDNTTHGTFKKINSGGLSIFLWGVGEWDTGTCYVGNGSIHSGGSKGSAPGAHPPPHTAQDFLNFMQFFGKFGKIVCWHPPEGWHPSYGESGSNPDPVADSGPESGFPRASEGHQPPSLG